MTTAQLIVSVFQDDTRATHAREVLQALAQDTHGLLHNNIATIHRNEQGEIAFWETAEQREFEDLSTLARLTGWIVGGVAMFLGAPLGPAYGDLTGNLAGGNVAIGHDVGFANQQLAELGGYIRNGSVALVLLLHAESAAPFIQALKALGGELIQDLLPAEMLHALTK